MPRTRRSLLAAAGSVVTTALLFGALASGAAAAGQAVSIGDGSFKPGRITIKVGDTVTWTNRGSEVHNVYGDGFASKDLGTGGRYPHTFKKAGTFAYVCTIHGFQGTVVVRSASATPKPTPKPTTPTAVATATPASETASPSASAVAVASVPAIVPPSAGSSSQPPSPDAGGTSSSGPALILLAAVVAAIAVGLGWILRRRRV